MALLFLKISIKLYLNFLPSFVVPYHSYIYQKWTLYVLLFPCQPVNGNIFYWPNCISYFGLLFFKLSPSFATCSSQLQGMTATPSGIFLYAHFCVSMTPFTLWLLFSKEYVTINIDIPQLLLCLTYKKTLDK